MNKVYIIGMGPGSGDYLLPAAKRAIEASDCLIGAKRHISIFRNLGKEEVPIEGHFDDVILYIKRYKDRKRLAILVSGDPGIYSLLEKISGALKPEEYIVIPGISAVQMAFARIGESWYGAKVISLHGRNTADLAGEIRFSPKVFIFTDPDLPPNRIAGNLLKEGADNRRAIVLENLSYPNESILDTDLRRLSRIKKRFGLCSMIIERYKPKEKKGKLYGIGLGPGDPGLVTLKAREILEEVDIIFAPKGSEDGESCARSIVEAVIQKPKTFVELTFPMTRDRAVLNRYWGRAAKEIATQIDKGKDAAFITIGDPFIYSTYVYLLKTLRRNFPDIAVETIPGVSSFNAASARAHIPLVEGDERLAVVPVRHDLKGLKEALEGFDTVVLMKVGSKLKKIVRLLKDMKLIKMAFLVSHVGHRDEKITRDLASLKGRKAGYLSCVIVKRKGIG